MPTPRRPLFSVLFLCLASVGCGSSVRIGEARDGLETAVLDAELAWNIKEMCTLRFGEGEASAFDTDHPVLLHALRLYGDPDVSLVQGALSDDVSQTACFPSAEPLIELDAPGETTVELSPPIELEAADALLLFVRRAECADPKCDYRASFASLEIDYEVLGP